MKTTTKLRKRPYGLALEMPGQIPRRRDAATPGRACVLDPKYEKLRPTAAAELTRHLQKNGLNLTADQVAQLRALYKASEGDPALRPSSCADYRQPARQRGPAPANAFWNHRRPRPHRPRPRKMIEPGAAGCQTGRFEFTCHAPRTVFSCLTL